MVLYLCLHTHSRDQQADNLFLTGCLRQNIAPVIDCTYQYKYCNHHKHKPAGSLLQVSCPVTVQALQEAKARSDAASAEVQRIHKEVTRLEVAIPKLQLEATAARQQATDLQHRLTQLSSAAQVSSHSLCQHISQISEFFFRQLHYSTDCCSTSSFTNMHADSKTMTLQQSLTRLAHAVQLRQP